jgi:ubiquitin carboxyl-terminal hydrolase 8
MYLSLPIPNSKKPITLEAAVGAFVSEETLEKEDAWHCPNCKQPRKASKRLTLARLPPILLIHLKRFSFKGPFSDKIDTPVQFPIYGLDLSPFLPTISQTDSLYSQNGPIQPSRSTYDLYGVSQHFGTLSSGHYTAIVRSRNTWNHISDSKIQAVDESEVRKALKSSYILWYRRN